MECDPVLEETFYENPLLVLHEVNKCNWNGIVKWLQVEFKVDRAKGLNFVFSENKVYILLRILENINKHFLWYNSLEKPIQETLTETLKALRNYVTNDNVATYLLNEETFYPIFANLIECIFTKKNGNEIYTRNLLHFFVNLLSVGTNDQRKVSRELVRSSFLYLFKQYFTAAYGHLYEASAVLYNLLSDVEIADIVLITHIIMYHNDPDKENEFLNFLLEQIISANFIWQTYEDLNVETRIILLSCLKEALINPDLERLLIKIKVLPCCCLERLVAIFNKSASVVFQVSQAGCTNASQEVSYILEILSHTSSLDEYLRLLQSNKDLFINAGVLLLNIHRLGQMSNNVFTPLQKLGQIDMTSDQDKARNPVFGFKADLVRLIGNLCWKNRNMQDLARTAEIIPVLLDSCNIDQKNPFIIQWVILAIRNICESNQENQAIIAGLTKQGVIGPDVLQEHGLTLHAENDLSIGLIELNLNK